MKKTKDGKYRRFITTLKQVSINVTLIETLEQIPGYAKFMNDMVTKKRSVSFEDDDRCNIVVLLLQGLLCKRKKI